MKLLCHIVAKDARRFLPAVSLWVAIFSVYVFSEWRLAYALPDDAEGLVRLRFFERLFFIVQLLTGYVFAAVLVLEDSPFGTSMFWLTRPISGSRLLAAKVVSCGLWFGVLAVLMAIPWWLVGEGETSGEIFVRGGKLLLWQTCVIGTAVVLAAFTGGLGRFLVWSIGAASAAFGVMLIDRLGILAVDSLRWLVATAIAALWMHYQLRRTRLALVLLAFGAISSAAIALASIG